MSPDNTSLIEWVVGIITAGLSAAIGHLHIRASGNPSISYYCRP